MSLVWREHSVGARIHLGAGKYTWLGSWSYREHGGKREAGKLAQRAEADWHRTRRHRAKTTCERYVLDTFLPDYERSRKRSSYMTASSALGVTRTGFRDGSFLAEFARREPQSITRPEAKDWAREATPGEVAVARTVFGELLEDELVDRNVFDGLSHKGPGRQDEPPPTQEEFQALLDACSTLGDQAGQMRALTRFAAFTLMRPGELWMLEPHHLDFKRMRIDVRLRLYGSGDVDLPKSGTKTIALVPPARDAILPILPPSGYVFRSKTGRRMSQGTLSAYWRLVLASAGLDFDFYHATKHYGVWYLHTQVELSDRAIAAQAGWSLGTVRKMLRVYGHSDVGALEEIDKAFGANVRDLRDARQTRTGGPGAG